MIELNISVDVTDAKRQLYGMRDREVRRAASNAINRTLTTVRKVATDKLKEVIGKELGLGASGLKKSIKMYRASARAGRLQGRLVPSGKHLPLINFKARKTSKGVSHSAWGRRQIAKGAFIAKMPGGHKGVYRRVPAGYAKRHTKGRPTTSTPNLPIKEMFGPSIPREFINKRVLWGMESAARKAWPKNFQRELDNQLRRRRNRRR